MAGITPYICVADTRAALAWWSQVFDARVSVEPIVMPDGGVGHAEVVIAGSRLMVSDEYPSAGVQAPDPARGNASTLHLETDDVDALLARARGAGALAQREVEDTPHGRVAVILDPFGHRWFLNQR